MNRKGLSQVLALIVAASVLMITALVIIFMTQGSLGSFGKTTEVKRCTGAVQTQCQVSGGSISIPSACTTGDGTSGDLRPEVQGQFERSGDQINCASLS